MEQWIKNEVFDQAPIPLVILGTDRRLLACNRVFAAQFGLDPGRSLANIDITTSMHPEDRQETEVYFTELVSGRLASHEMEKRYIRIDGSDFWGRLTAAPVTTGSGDIVAVCCSIVDITHERTNRQALLGIGNSESGIDEVGVDTATTTFVAAVGHELRAPLHAISGLAEILSLSEFSAADHKIVSSIQRESENLKYIVDDLLDLSKVEAGKFELKSEVYSPGKLAAEIRELLIIGAQRKNLSLVADVAASTPLKVVGDGHRVRQIVVNLVSNALRYTDEGAVTIRVEAPNRNEIRFDVVDTGPGIANEEMERLFEVFEQTHDGRVGTGLGLAVSKQLADLMGGSLDVMSQLGQGTTFSLIVPARAAERQTDEPEPSDQPTGAGHILVAEDGEVNQLLATNQLLQLGYQSTVVENGALAVEAVATDNFDAVLMDWHMPVMDGLEATRQIRALEGRGSSIPIIAVTASAMQGNRELCLEAGMNDFLSKPASIKDLSLALERWVPNGSEAPAEPPTDEPTKAITTADSVNDSPVVDPKELGKLETDLGDGSDELSEPPTGEPTKALTTADSVNHSLVVDPKALDKLATDLGDPEIVATVIKTFLHELDLQINPLAQMQKLLDDGTAVPDTIRDQARRSAHTLKSTSSLLGSTKLAEHCASTETHLAAAIADDNPPALTNLSDELNELLSTANRASQELQNYLDTENGRVEI